MSRDHKQGKTIHSKAQELAANIIMACDIEANQKELLSPLAHAKGGHSNTAKPVFNRNLSLMNKLYGPQNIP
jgi:hypothetical protein